MIESYAEAPSSLGDHISELNEQTQTEARRVNAFSAVADVAKKLFGATPNETPGLLEGLVGSIASNLRCTQASFALLWPDGNLEQIVSVGLQVDPLVGVKTPGGRPLAQAIVDGAKAIN
jgi:hypothetical protein